MGDGIIRSATFSPCRTWRYTLDREWEKDYPRCLFVLLNPSIADEHQDDPTNRRGIGFAKAWNCGSVTFVNLFAWRTPDPAELKTAPDPVGPENDAAILREAQAADRIVIAWGNDGAYMNRNREVFVLLREFKLHCLGRTVGGHPRHPLYMRKDTELEEWS